jgi:hypothetical protein
LPCSVTKLFSLLGLAHVEIRALGVCLDPCFQRFQLAADSSSYYLQLRQDAIASCRGEVSTAEIGSMSMTIPVRPRVKDFQA